MYLYIQLEIMLLEVMNNDFQEMHKDSKEDIQTEIHDVCQMCY